jgi:hypothetical protein
MSLDEQLAELHQRVISSRTNAVIARNVALDGLRALERTVGEMRRKLDHDELEDLDTGGTIPYAGIFGTTAFDIERNLVRVVHFLSDMKVAQHDREELLKDVALAKVADLPRVHALTPVENGPWIDHPFVPKPDAWQYCASTYKGTEGDTVQCGMRIEGHKVVQRCGMPKEAHSPQPSSVYGIDSPHGHTFMAPRDDEGRIGGLDCQYPVPPSVDLHSHRFQGGNGSQCTYSSYGVECGGIRRDHELL